MTEHDETMNEKKTEHHQTLMLIYQNQVHTPTHRAIVYTRRDSEQLVSMNTLRRNYVNRRPLRLYYRQ